MTEKAYIEDLERIKRENPGEALLPTLERGFSALQAIYLRQALARLPKIPAVQEEVPARPPDDTLRGLWAERRRLFGEQAKMSNRFHDCKTDTDRADISDSILRIWASIQDVKSRIEYYEQYGELPPVVENERFPLPDDRGALVKKLNSIRAQISQVQAVLRELAELPDHHPDKTEKILAAEKRRAELVLYRGHAEQKIKNTTVHGG